MRNVLLLSIAVVFCGAVPTTASADVLDSENFESFSNVPFEIVDDDDWEVSAGNEAVVNVIEANLSYSRGAVSVDGGNRALELGPDMPGATTNNFADWIFEEVSADQHDSVWFSFLLQTSETASTAIPDISEDRDFFQLHFSADGNQGQSVSVVLDNQTPVVEGLGGDHIFRARAGSSSNVTDTGQNFRTTPDVPQFVVGNIEAVNGEYETISIFMNPGLPVAPATPTAMATFGGVEATTLAQFTARISALEPEDVYLLDELIIGESYEDVASIDPNFLLGDFDLDGELGFADFLILAANLFEGTAYEQGDFDFSGLVDLHDFVAFREAFNAGAGVAAAVPEPSGMILLCTAVCLLGLSRRWRR